MRQLMMANDVDPDSAAYSMLMKSCHLDLILLWVAFFFPVIFSWIFHASFAESTVVVDSDIVHWREAFQIQAQDRESSYA